VDELPIKPKKLPEALLPEPLRESGIASRRAAPGRTGPADGRAAPRRGLADGNMPPAGAAGERGSYRLSGGQTMPLPTMLWEPRWKWVGKLLGRQVPTPTVWLLPQDAETAEETQEAGSVSTEKSPPAVAPQQAVAAPQQAVAPQNGAAAPQSSPPQAPQAADASWKSWAFPLITVLAGLAVVFGLGFLLGVDRALGRTPAALRSGPVAVLLDVPVGGLLLLLGSFACLVQAHDDAKLRWVWRLAAVLLAAFAVWVWLGGWL
jgi:hypothetical protein